MNEEKNDEETISLVAVAGNKDWFLQELVHMTNMAESSQNITLNVSGFLISGTLIGGKEYFEILGSEMSSGLSGESAKNVKNFFSRPAEIYTSEEYKESPDPNIGFIHLKDAKCFHPSGPPIPSNRGTLWRGRIEEVSGFSFGLLSTENPNSTDDDIDSVDTN